MIHTVDFLIIGGGIIGLCTAKEIKSRFPDCSVHLLEKESQCGLHASGRNSGVLHAGFYYSADSLKARFCKDGNKALTDYCRDRRLAINPCGKLVVAQSQTELVALDALYQRGQDHGIPLRMIDEQEAKAIEPRVKTVSRAIFSPTTATVDPKQVTAALLADAIEEGIVVHYDSAYVAHEANRVITKKDIFDAGFVVNAAGVYADKIAKEFGFSEDYVILPFKGIYLYGSSLGETLRTNIYPVPDLNYPFLGVHFTVTVDAKNKIGPTAIPAFWREHYQGLENFQMTELWQIAMLELGLFVNAGFDFRGLAFAEMKKYYRPYLVNQAAKLVHDVALPEYQQWGHPGIRAQLIDCKSRKLVMDFCLQNDKHSLHILNAVSPAFTCSLPFAKYVCDIIVAEI